MVKKNLAFEKIFSDSMVLPQNKTFHIAGYANPDDEVSVQIDTVCKKVSTNSKGKWVATFSAMSSANSQTVVAESAEDKVEIHHVRFGKVILLAGQSNIEYKLVDDQEYDEILKQISFQNAYFFNVPKVEFTNSDGTVIPDDLPEPRWQQVDKDTIGEMSAVGFYMLEELLREFPGQTIGVVDCYKGGTSASSWVSKQVLENDSELRKIFIVPFETQTTGKTESDFKNELIQYQKSVEVHNTKLEQYLKQNPNASLSTAKDTVGHTPWPPPLTPKSFLRPSGLYENMVLTIKNYTFDDVVWYQGENDAPNPQVYETLLKDLLQNWRELFRDRSLSFYIIQLPGYADEPKDAWAVIRQAQLNTVKSVPNTHLISISDTGDEHNIHPVSKRKAGTRVGKVISGLQYSSTPYVSRIELANSKINLSISHASQLNISDDCDLEVLVDGKWQKRKPQEIKDNLISILNLDDIKGIRYEYKNYPNLTIFNEVGFPVSPFEFLLE